MVVGEMILETDVLVIGGGPGGYTAAIRAADLGKDVVLVESRKELGGVCLAEGCIPSKTIIHAVGLSQTLARAGSMGLIHKGLSFDLAKLRRHVKKTVKVLSSGVSALVADRDIERVRGHARFKDPNTVYVDGANTIIRFKYAVVAPGSLVRDLPGELGGQTGIWTPAQALDLPEVPETLLVVGAGYVGLELGQAYAGLGSRVTLAAGAPLLPGTDPDLVAVLAAQCEKEFDALVTGADIVSVDAGDHGFRVGIQSKGKPPVVREFSRILAAGGHRPNTGNLGLDVIGLTLDDQGRIPTDETCRTAVSHIFAVGDATIGPALAHKAAREGKVAAEVICGLPSAFDNVAVPAVLFTRPQIAWAGMSEADARARGMEINVGKFPMTALGKARSTGQTSGFVKVLADKGTGSILGASMVGEHASERIAEAVLAIEMGATLEDLMVAIHPHPSFSEAIMEAAEAAGAGSVHMMKKEDI